MVGYLQELLLDEALVRVNDVATLDLLPPLHELNRNGEASAEFEQILDRPFPLSPFRLTHIWARVVDSPG